MVRAPLNNLIRIILQKAFASSSAVGVYPAFRILLTMVRAPLNNLIRIILRLFARDMLLLALEHKIAMKKMIKPHSPSPAFARQKGKDFFAGDGMAELVTVPLPRQKHAGEDCRDDRQKRL
ncbi:hypothetical protein PF004_g31536 [Phytophthora fragariae]|uniref:Uncharacterized protein n=2 Tax=Phytophthora fragariae TaxID=53985 RepID=A0A6G0M950_9STRA|nr:hypothetical protein PF004_g31536 [Phytophthora fragariae]